MYFILGFIFGLIVVDLYFNEGKTIKYVLTKIIKAIRNLAKDIKEYSKEK